MDAAYKTEDNLIDGCQSRVWLHAEMREGLVHFEADSDAIITKGLIALLIRVLSDHTPAEILESDVHFIDAIGLTRDTGCRPLLHRTDRTERASVAYPQQRIAVHAKTD